MVNVMAAMDQTVMKGTDVKIPGMKHTGMMDTCMNHTGVRLTGMKRSRHSLAASGFLLVLILGAAVIARGQDVAGKPGNIAVINPRETMDQIVAKAAHVIPSPRQLAWQELEFIAFVHFGTNTFSDREWGLGTENPANFNPSALDARQWVKVIKDAGMKLVIVTAKHHDGLCLWPSKYTNHSVKRSPWKGGKGDVVGEVAAACKEFGLKFGVYLSPWDRHEQSYGSEKYNEHFCNQLRELLTEYGEVSEVWFDGANGEASNGKRQVYDWQSYYTLIRELQPGAVIAIMGPDVRWVGTESGYGRETEWSVVPDIAQNFDTIASGSQQNPVDGAFVPRDLMAEDLGSREKLKGAQALVWYPSEVDVSIRPGWFYHANQDDRVKSPQKLVDIYYSSVGRNSVLLLNLPPDRRGIIHENDVKSLKGMRAILDRTFSTNLAGGATVRASDERADHTGALAADGDNTTYWTPKEGVTSAALEFVLPSVQTFDCAMLQERIRVGQRVERFRIEAWDGAAWTQVAKGTTIGYKRLLRFPSVTATKVRLVVEESRTNPTLSSFGLYKAPPRVTIEPDGGAFEDSLTVRLASDGQGVAIHYTLDGTIPTLQSPRYISPILLTSSATVTALPAVNGELGSESSETRFLQSKRVRAITFERPYSPRYTGHGDQTVIDGRRASAAFDDGKWLGFEADDLVVALDLGSAQAVKKVTAGFLQQQGSWIFLPSRVTCAVSLDGKSWQNLSEVTYPPAKSAEVVAKDCIFPAVDVKARYIRIVARNIGTCPPWHDGAGSKAWLFVDEIYVE